MPHLKVVRKAEVKSKKIPPHPKSHQKTPNPNFHQRFQSRCPITVVIKTAGTVPTMRRVTVSLEPTTIFSNQFASSMMTFKDTLNHILHTCTVPQWQGHFRLALVVCGKHWHGLLSSQSPTSVGYLSTLRERICIQKICYFNKYI